MTMNIPTMLSMTTTLGVTRCECLEGNSLLRVMDVTYNLVISNGLERFFSTPHQPKQ
jgi:hypothetical protein